MDILEHPHLSKLDDVIRLVHSLPEIIVFLIWRLLEQLIENLIHFLVFLVFIFFLDRLLLEERPVNVRVQLRRQDGGVRIIGLFTVQGKSTGGGYHVGHIRREHILHH